VVPSTCSALRLIEKHVTPGSYRDGMTDPSDTTDPQPPRPDRPIASPSRVTVEVGGETKWVGPANAEDALNKAKDNRLTARWHLEQRNASDLDHCQAAEADRTAQTYALISIAESLVELTRAVREINERGLRQRGHPD
jgi:hypothetical protein